MKQQYLLIEDVEDIGRRGEVISVRSGFARNFLLPKQKAVPANDHTLGMQARLQEERAKQAQADRKQAEAIAEKLTGITLKTTAKIDPEGNMYGSVGNSEVLELFAKEGITLDRRNIGLNKPIKEIGVHSLSATLKEGVKFNYTLHIVGQQATASEG